MKLINALILGTLVMCLSSCLASSKNNENMQIYQATTLKLKAGVRVQTSEGTYTPQVDETWVSYDQYITLVNNYVRLTAEIKGSSTSADASSDSVNSETK